MTRALPALLLFACADPPTPIIEAHRGAAGYYPQNSRTAMLASLEDGYAGLELDLVLTADGIPVLHHDPWVHESLCERVDGEPVGRRVRVDGLTLERLLQTYTCGGPPDPDFPNAAVYAEPIMTFAELLVALRDADASILVHLDIKYEPGWTPAPEQFADAVLSRWFDADPPQPFYVSANTPETIEAFETWGALHGREIPTSLAWPRFPIDSDPTGLGLSAELATALGTTDPLREAERVGADGLALYWELASRSTVQAAVADGRFVSLWTINDPGVLRAHARWPVRTLITDYPGDLP